MEKLEPQSEDLENFWIIGGSSLYSEVMNNDLCHRIYLTKIDKSFDCDTFFPDFESGCQFETVSDPDVPEDKQSEDGIEYTYKVYQRK